MSADAVRQGEELATEAGRMAGELSGRHHRALLRRDEQEVEDD